MDRPLRNIGANELTRVGYIHCGKLRKKGAVARLLKMVKKWPSVFVVLTKSFMYIFDDEYSTKPSSIYNVGDFETVKEVYEDNVVECFCIKHHDPTKGALFFGSETCETRKEWISRLRAAIKETQDSGCSVTSYSSNYSDQSLEDVQQEHGPTTWDYDSIDDGNVGATATATCTGIKTRRHGVCWGPFRSNAMSEGEDNATKPKTSYTVPVEPFYENGCIIEDQTVSNDTTELKVAMHGDIANCTVNVHDDNKNTHVNTLAENTHPKVIDDHVYENCRKTEVMGPKTSLDEEQCDSEESDEPIYENMGRGFVKESYFVEGNVSRAFIETKMKTRTEGTFCVYWSGTSDAWTLVVMTKLGVKFYKIKEQDGHYFLVKDHMFASIEVLIDFYGQHPFSCNAIQIDIIKGIYDT